MNDIHRNVFERFQKGVDQGVPARVLRAELQEHLAGCLECRMDIELHQRLRAELALRWPATLESRRSAGETLAAMKADVDRRRRSRLVFKPVRVVAWVALAILLILGADWVLTNLRPQPAVTPAPTGVEEVAPPPQEATPTPGPSETSLPKISLKPIATGASQPGRGLWSLDSQWVFFDLVETGEDPRSDRRMTTFNFLNPETGEVCQQPQKLLGVVNLSSLVRWLPENRLLFISWWEEPPEAQPDGNRSLEEHQTFVSGSPGVYLITPCDDEILSLDDHFSEAILGLPTSTSEGRYVLLRGESHYWLLDPESLNARALEGLLSSLEDRVAWSPSGEQLAIYQPAPGDQAAGGRITLFHAESGEAVRTIELFSEGTVGMLDWLLDETIYIWIFSEAGPVLVDLAASQPRVIPVLPELFGLDLVYPDEFSADTSVADESAGTYHIAFKVNTAADKATYLYHSESGQVEKLPEGHTYLIFPNGDFEPLNQWEDEPTYTDEFDLVWVDEAEKGIQHISVEGHTPRDYPILWPRLVPNRTQIAFASSQGVSLVSIPDGQLLHFWSLEGGGDPGRPVASPDGRFLVVDTRNPDTGQTAPGGAFYLIPLEP